MADMIEDRQQHNRCKAGRSRRAERRNNVNCHWQDDPDSTRDFREADKQGTPALIRALARWKKGAGRMPRLRFTLLPCTRARADLLPRSACRLVTLPSHNRFPAHRGVPPSGSSGEGAPGPRQLGFVCLTVSYARCFYGRLLRQCTDRSGGLQCGPHLSRASTSGGLFSLDRSSEAFAACADLGCSHWS